MFSTLFWNLKFGSGPGHRVTGYIGGISWLLVNWEKKTKKKLGVLNNFCFLFNFEISNIDWPCDSHSQLFLLILETQVKSSSYSNLYLQNMSQRNKNDYSDHLISEFQFSFFSANKLGKFLSKPYNQKFLCTNWNKSEDLF